MRPSAEAVARAGLPLSGVRVLDLTRLAPGPYATLVLADLGAEVLKLEPPEGDATRAMPAGGDGELFAALNRGKRSVVLDLKRAGAVEAVRRVLARCDVLVEGFRPGTMDRLGLGHAALLEAFPRLVVCALSGFGQSGPDRGRAGHDLGYVARAGLLAMGGRDGAPAIPGPQVADIGGAWVAVSGVLAALLERARTGRGRLVDVSLVESATSFAALHLGPALLGLPVPPAGQGFLDGGLPSYGLYRTADDRWLAVAALEPKFFGALCERLGLGDLTADAYGGGEGAERVRALLARTFAGAPLATWQERLAGLDACVEPVLLPEEVSRDAHLRARGLFPGSGVLASPLHLGPPASAPAPGLGEHTREVLAEAGLTTAEIDALAG
ncbi:MAG TPA: CoA transferase [Myxococcaceae bacterium]|jgi:crotonobetainyl-CoA:carnitine CoA-transferase CaiB-like acyl-CoA transferase